MDNSLKYSLFKGDFMKHSLKYSLIFSALFIFSVFFMISYLSPLAGDDWGYAVNGQLYNPFKLAFEFYFTWSGRFFSELYGFLITPNKWVWNILNPFLFSIILIFSFLISNSKNKLISLPLIIFLMLSVKDELRMETYTWLMGTTYVIPLSLSLIYLFNVKQFILKKVSFTSIHHIINGFCLVIVGMSMENIAAALFFMNIVVLIYYYLVYKKLDKTLLLYTLISTLSFALLRLSPGASLRLLRDHPTWVQLNLIDQIVINYPNLIRFTFIENRYLVLFFSLGQMIVLIKEHYYNPKRKYITFLSILILFIALFSSISLTLSHRLTGFNLTSFLDYQSLFNLLFWPIYTINIFFILTYCLNGNNRKISIFLLLIAGLTNGAMLLSPIFSYRSSLYTVYFIITLTSLLFQELDIRWSNLTLSIILILLISKVSLNYYEKYKFVQNVTQLRKSQIDYYVDHPEIKEAWLVRYPSYSIHSGDIEEWDEYHKDVFRRYFGISPDVRLVFYNEDWNKIGQ